MDGVIVDSNPFHKVALRQFCKKHGRDLSEEELKERIYGRTNRDWLLNIFPDLTDEEIARYADEKEEIFRELYANDIVALAGLGEFLKAARTLGIPMAIATSAPLENVDFTLAKTGLREYFPVILYDKFVTKGKPDPEIYIKACAALELPPGDCVVFEDSLSGVTAARRAGCRVVGIMTTHNAEELVETDLVIADFQDIGPEAVLEAVF